MKLLSIKKKETIELIDFDVATINSGCAVIKMELCGICGSDVTAYLGTNPTMKYPIDGIGHEGVGTIVEIDETHSNPTNLKIGDRVALEPYVPCNSCHMCAQKRYNNCTDIRVCGVHKDGMMAEFFTHPIDLLYKLPDELDFTRAALVEPLTIGLHGVSRAGVTANSYCVIFGAGTIGIMAAFSVIEEGATPIVIDIIDSKLERAKDLGIQHTFNSKTGDVVQYLMDVTNNKLPEHMVDCSGSPFVIKEMHNYVCHGGKIALVGWPHSPVEINTVRCTQKELDILPSRNSNNKFPTAIQMVNNNKIPSDKMISKVITLSEVEDVIKEMIASPDKYIKVIVECK